MDTSQLQSLWLQVANLRDWRVSGSSPDLSAVCVFVCVWVTWSSRPNRSYTETYFWAWLCDLGWFISPPRASVSWVTKWRRRCLPLRTSVRLIREWMCGSSCSTGHLACSLLFPSPPRWAEPLWIPRAQRYSLPSSLTPMSAGKVLIWEWWAEVIGERSAVLREGLSRPRRVTHWRYHFQCFIKFILNYAVKALLLQSLAWWEPGWGAVGRAVPALESCHVSLPLHLHLLATAPERKSTQTTF